jgi:hypothetical protein
MSSILGRFPLRLQIGDDDASQLLTSGLSFSNVDPGGYEACSIPIPKDMPRTLVGEDVRLECGLATAWEGRVAEVQRSLGANTTLMCEGYGAILKEDTAQVIFVDRDMSKWGPPSVARTIAYVGGSTWGAMGSATVKPDEAGGTPGLDMEISGDWPSGKAPWIEAWFDAAGLDIGSIYYAWKQQNLTPSDSGWRINVGAAATDADGSAVNSSDLLAAGPGSGTLTPGAGKKFGKLQWYYAFGPAGGQNASWHWIWTCLAVYGNHGLTKRGTDTATDAQGFFAEDIARWVVAQNSKIAAGLISDTTGYIIPHLTYPEPSPLETITADAAKFIGCHWGVWEALNPLYDPRPRLDFRPYPSEPTAWCNRKDCSTLDINEQLAQLYDTIVVTYTNPQFSRTEFVTVTSTNPLLAAARQTGRTLPVNGGTMTPARAADHGALMLALLLLQARVAGQATLINTVQTPRGELPPFLLKAGLDRLRITDLPGADVAGTYSNMPIKRVECMLSDDSIETHVEIGTGADLIETLQARLDEVATILGF